MVELSYIKFVIAFAISIISFSCFDNQKTANGNKSILPEVKIAPVFRGENYDGGVFESSTLKGSVWVATFMFTSCGGVCPVMNGNQEIIQTEFLNDNVKFVSITVDPDTDTKEELSSYAKKYNAIKNKWYFLRMNLDTVRDLAVKGFLVSDPIEPSAHSPRYILVDKLGMIRGYYDSMDSLKVTELRKSISLLLNEN